MKRGMSILCLFISMVGILLTSSCKRVNAVGVWLLLSGVEYRTDVFSTAEELEAYRAELGVIDYVDGYTEDTVKDFLHGPEKFCKTLYITNKTTIKDYTRFLLVDFREDGYYLVDANNSLPIEATPQVTYEVNIHGARVLLTTEFIYVDE